MTRRALAGFMRGLGMKAKAVQTLQWGRTGVRPAAKGAQGTDGFVGNTVNIEAWSPDGSRRRLPKEIRLPRGRLYAQLSELLRWCRLLLSMTGFRPLLTCSS